jgi:Flp pilus assembly pilin Flp
MYQIAKTCYLLWKQRWDALREDEGASTIEYTLLILLGIAVAVTVTAVVKTAVDHEDTQITENSK